MRSRSALAAAMVLVCGAGAQAMLNPALGRFMQRDPMGYVDGANCYATYHLASSGMDPTGLTRHVFVFEGMMGYNDDNRSSMKKNEDEIRKTRHLPNSVKDKTGKRVKNPAKTFVEDQIAKPGLLDSYPAALEQLIGYGIISTGLTDTKWHYYSQHMAPTAATLKEIEDIARKPLSPQGATGVNACHNTIIIVGFSNGGSAAIETARRLGDRSITVDLLYTVDPVPRAGAAVWSAVFGWKFTKPGNTTRAINYYQREHDPKGWPMSNADNAVQLVGDKEAKQVGLREISHMTMPFYARTVAGANNYTTEISNVPAVRSDYKAKP